MTQEFHSGDFLIATASLQDSNFAGSVVLICDHDEDRGTYGIVLNRPIETIAEIREVLQFPLETLYQGGPVNPQAVQVLHPYGDAVPGSLPILPGLWIGGDLDAIIAGIQEKRFNPQYCRFFIGYAGWEKNQLAREIMDDSWLLVQGDAAIIENTPPEALWAAAIRLYGRRHALFKHFPLSPDLN